MLNFSNIDSCRQKQLRIIRVLTEYMIRYRKRGFAKKIPRYIGLFRRYKITPTTFSSLVEWGGTV